MHERRILLAEPDPDHAAKLTAMLESLKYSVERVESGLAALQRLQDADTPEMALLSSNLPLMSGMEVAMEIRRRIRRRQLWLMLMSGTPSTDEVAMATDAGIDEFLVKPVDRSELRMRIRTGERVQSVYQEITDSAGALEFHATHDPLTGAWRREAMLDLLFQETDRVQRLRTPASLLLMDIDRFTDLNLRHGYAMGDKLLPLLHSRLRNQLRSYDMIGRFGEDEFLIALPGCLVQHAEQQAERLRQVISRRAFTVDGTDLHITASFGVAESLGRSPLIVLREAERALASAKLRGRDCVSVYDTVDGTQAVLPEARRKPVLNQKI
ncbi:MAG TPA: diguanylate cyclase [Acidobacteriaceae bacterium]|jgi:diguanylate cyclase (GGDEF)-like protein|nr:diguanylate cyclase [Acidobacteriaceae bacterium]